MVKTWRLSFFGNTWGVDYPVIIAVNQRNLCFWQPSKINRQMVNGKYRTWVKGRGDGTSSEIANQCRLSLAVNGWLWVSRCLWNIASSAESWKGSISAPWDIQASTEVKKSWSNIKCHHQHNSKPLQQMKMMSYSCWESYAFSYGHNE